MPGIFISYRREDSAAYAGRLYDWLSQRFGKEAIFIDIDTIQPGEDFVEVVEQKVGACDALIALIGKNWLSCVDEEGKRRLDNPDDFVHLEIATALHRNVRVIPVLLDGARMPRGQELPEPLTKLVRRNALELSYTRFHQDVERLMEALEKALAAAGQSGKEAAEKQRREAEEAEAEKLKREKAESERFAAEKAEAGRKSRELEEERRKAQEEAREKAEVERLEREKTEAERKAREKTEADRAAAERAEAAYGKMGERAGTGQSKVEKEAPPNIAPSLRKWWLAGGAVLLVGAMLSIHYSRQEVSTTSTPGSITRIRPAVTARSLEEVLRDAKPLELPRPPFEQFNSGRLTGAIEPLRLEEISQTRNGVIDTENWFPKNSLVWPAYKVPGPPQTGPEGLGPLPAAIPTRYQGDLIAVAIPSGRLILAGYGPDYGGIRYLAGMDAAAGKVQFVFDFQSYVAPPKFIAPDREYVDEKVQWAAEENGVLYVSNFHSTYAKSSYGLNGYLTALDFKTGELIWRSRSLICNSQNFVLHRDVIIAGYGFTAEPHFLYVLSKNDGAILQTIPLRKMAERILVKGDKVFVRTYDTDYVFRCVPGARIQ